MPDMFWRTAGVILRSTDLSAEDWVELLEARRLQFKHYLGKFTLKTLGEVECLWADNWGHSINRDSPAVTSGSGVDLQTQGLFFIGKKKNEGSGQPYNDHAPYQSILGGTINLWGLSRSDQWVLATVKFKREPGYKNRGYDRAIQVDARYTDALGIIEIAEDPEKAWNCLDLAVSRWVQERERLLDQARELLVAVLAETAAVKAIMRRTAGT